MFHLFVSFCNLHLIPICYSIEILLQPHSIPSPSFYLLKILSAENLLVFFVVTFPLLNVSSTEGFMDFAAILSSVNRDFDINDVN